MKRWHTAEVDAQRQAALARDTGLPPSLVRALLARGLDTPAALDRFLNPRLSDLSDPFALPGMQAAVTRIWQAVRSGERVVVYGDYDVDGVAATALVVEVLRGLGAKVDWCLPNRLEEGYGLGVEALERCLQERAPRLIVTVDCGTGSHEAVQRARAAGVDVVVTDHHDVCRQPVSAAAVVNPKLGGPAGTRMLAGVGVAFKLCHALLKRGREAGVPAAAGLDLRSFLDLVALGTIADIVPLRDESRILAVHGLAMLNRRERLGLKVLAEVAGLRGTLGPYHIAFVLGPRLNAAGRLGGAEAALELLLCHELGRARELAATLEAANRDRKRIETGILDTTLTELEQRFDPRQHYGIVVGSPGWHVGVVGIVAARLVARYGRPAVVVGFDADGVGRGSGRSIGGFDLVAALQACADDLLSFGGHAMAAGLELRSERFESFRKAFEAACAATLRDRDLRPRLHLDAWVNMDELTSPAFLDGWRRMQPFGEGNPEPLWGLRGVTVVGTPRILKAQHLKLTVTAAGRDMEAIGFGMGEREVPAGRLDLACTLREDSYGGRTSMQLQLADLRPARSREET